MLVDRPSASQEVHLLRALRRLRNAGECALCIWSEDDAREYSRTDRNWIAQELDRLDPNLLVLSRFAGSETQAAISAARARNVPVVSHLDDYLLEIPPDLGPEKVKQHMKPERIASLKASLTQADLLYISTSALASKVRSVGVGTPIVISSLQSCADPDEIVAPPHYDPEMFRPVRIGYQGTRNHIHDLRMLAPQLIAAMEARPDTTLTLFGTIEPPDELNPIAHRIRRIQPAGDYAQFISTLSAQHWDIGMAPLRDLEFNSFRTYTKWTEYTIAGVCVIATDSVVYRPVMNDGAGLLVPNDGWRDGLVRLIDDALERRSMVDKAQHILRTSHSLEAQEGQVMAMFRSVLKS